MKILITGGTGQLGRDCARILAGKHRVFSLSSKDLDISKAARVKALVHDLKPELILNCAAFTRVDDCERQREIAWNVNAEGPGNLAKAAHRLGGRIMHISTDYVFDGRKPVPEPYRETDVPRPASYYGVSKLAGEKAILEATDRYMIVRTAWLYGVEGGNFLKTMLKLALCAPEQAIRVVHDQYGSPTWSYRLALQIEQLIKADLNGVFHATSEGYCTWYELAVQFLDEMQIPKAIVPCTTADYPTPAKRPRNSILENQRLKDEGLNIMRNWRNDVVKFAARFKDRLISEVS